MFLLSSVPAYKDQADEAEYQLGLLDATDTLQPARRRLSFSAAAYVALVYIAVLKFDDCEHVP